MMNLTSSIMASEAAQVPTIIAKQLQENDKLTREIGAKIREFAPNLVYMVGRGSSDHAGVFAKYLIEIEAGLPVASSAPSVSGVYHQALELNRALVIVVSQSGRSPDIINQVEMAKKSGAMCVGLVNDENSPLALLVDYLIPLRAGEEKAVAATKSYLATLSGLLQLVAHWQTDNRLLDGLNTLSAAMQETISQPAQLGLYSLNSESHLVILGRGFGYAIAREIALKVKEVCSLHAEAFSSAEFLHGPIALAQGKLLVIDVCIPDESLLVHEKQIDEIKSRGVPVIQLNQGVVEVHPRMSALIVMLRFYLDIADISVAMGKNPDSPVGLKKVTQTV